MVVVGRGWGSRVVGKGFLITQPHIPLQPFPSLSYHPRPSAGRGRGERKVCLEGINKDSTSPPQSHPHSSRPSSSPHPFLSPPFLHSLPMVGPLLVGYGGKGVERKRVGLVVGGGVITTLTPRSLTHSSFLLIPSLTPPPYNQQPACDSKMGIGSREGWVRWLWV